MVGQSVRITVDVSPEGEVTVRDVEAAADSLNSVVGDGDARTSGRQEYLAAAQAQGEERVAIILSGDDMLSADAMAKMLGTTRVTINSKRQNHQLLGLEGAKRGVRYPRWQIGADGKPFDALPALFERLGESPWAVYRFLVQRHAELGGLTGREALAKGRQAEAIEAAESVAEAYS